MRAWKNLLVGALALTLFTGSALAFDQEQSKA
jgi:hypothetical protein